MPWSFCNFFRINLTQSFTSILCNPLQAYFTSLFNCPWQSLASILCNPLQSSFAILWTWTPCWLRAWCLASCLQHTEAIWSHPCWSKPHHQAHIQWLSNILPTSKTEKPDTSNRADRGRDFSKKDAKKNENLKPTFGFNFEANSWLQGGQLCYGKWNIFGPQLGFFEACFWPQKMKPNFGFRVLIFCDTEAGNNLAQFETKNLCASDPLAIPFQVAFKTLCSLLDLHLALELFKTFQKRLAAKGVLNWAVFKNLFVLIEVGSGVFLFASWCPCCHWLASDNGVN